MSRLAPLDWLRGLLAVSIMVYHLTSWKLYEPGADALLGRLGIYGVSMFFVLSGLAMAAGYAHYIQDRRTLISFFVRRIFRIWPMLWLAVAVVTLGGVVVKGQPVDWGLVLLNLTTAFGFVSPGQYINTGAWSIGNEMVYYALTPALLGAFNRSIRVGNVVVALAFAVAMYFAFWALSDALTLAAQWQTYIHPLNNLVLYAVGVALYYNTSTWVWRPVSAWLLMLISVATLALIPASGDLIHIVTGGARVGFIVASTLLVLSFYKLTSALPKALSTPLSMLGAATYGVYLLHPIVNQFVELAARWTGIELPAVVAIGLVIAVTIVSSLIVYTRFELPMIRLGKRLTATSAKRPTNGSDKVTKTAGP